MENNMQPIVTQRPIDLAQTAFTLKAGTDFIDIKVAVIERNSLGLIRIERSADGTISVPSASLDFGETFGQARARITGTSSPGTFLSLIERRTEAHSAVCLFEQKPERASGDWSTIREISKYGNAEAKLVAAELGSAAAAPESQEPWQGAASRYDELAGFRYIGLGVGAIIINADNKVLMGLRGKAVRQEAGCWDFPGGGVELGQSSREAVRRELLEEHELTVEPERLLEVIEHFSARDGTHWISATYLCRTEATKVVIGEKDKCDGAGFFGIDEIEALPLTICARRTLGLLKEILSNRGA